MRTQTSAPSVTRLPHPAPQSEGAQQHSRGSQTPLPPETDDSNNSDWELGDSCYIPVTVEGVPCLALLDTGSTVTVVRPDVVPEGTRLKPTLVPLRTVTGELAPIQGRGVLSVTVGGRTLHHPAWIAAVQDTCILGLDFLNAVGCQLDLLRGTVSFQAGPVITLSPRLLPDTPPGRHAANAVETVVVHSFPRALSPVSHPQTENCSISPSRDLSVAAPPSLPQTGEERVLTAVREMGEEL